MNFAVRAGGALLAAAVAALAATAPAEAQRKVSFKMHSSFPGTLPITGVGGKTFAAEIEALSADSLEFRFFEPGALVPGIQYLEPVSKGSVDAAWGTAGYHVGTLPAFAFFAAIPFGPALPEHLAWFRHGGGKEIYDEFYARFGIKGVLCMAIPPEASGWFRKEIKSLDDLKGLKMRFFGYGGKILEKFGVAPQLTAGGDIYPALELGTIDGTEFAAPVIDEKFGFFRVAKHYYFPGWHQVSTLFDVIMHGKKYDELSAQHKAMIDAACGNSIQRTIAEGEGTQADAMTRMQAAGVTLHRWPDDILKRFEATWVEMIEVESAKDADVKKAWDSQKAFRAKNKIWRDFGYMR